LRGRGREGERGRGFDEWGILHGNMQFNKCRTPHRENQIFVD
jgi:hypothetical protein